ncbi:MAG: dTDP-glucose 4,6-dehydratase [Desulfobacterales bacterium]|nr:dTDP-glucose 4,6-dehydratase [Desulfobacterales bacterium]
MQCILVTGGCGFIGANFIRFLLEDTDFSGRIINVDALTYAGNPENLEGLDRRFPDRYRFVHADVCDREKMAEIFTTYPVDTVCHFAAESHVDRSIVAPDAFIRTNIMGTFNLLELARTHQDRLALFHHVSTDEVFGSLDETGHFTEKTPYDPSSPYSASKAASDHLVRAYHRTYKIPVTLSNCSNNYGPYQFPEKLIPLMILNALEGRPLPVYGDGRNVRDWLYVKDHCRAIWMIMQQGRWGETYNIGGRSEMKNIDVVRMICDLLDEMAPPDGKMSRRNLISFVKDRPGHDLRYAMDSSKLETETGWKPAESFESGLRKTIEWYLAHSSWVGRVRDGEYQTWMDRQYPEMRGRKGSA